MKAPGREALRRGPTKGSHAWLSSLPSYRGTTKRRGETCRRSPSRLAARICLGSFERECYLGFVVGPTAITQGESPPRATGVAQWPYDTYWSPPFGGFPVHELQANTCKEPHRLPFHLWTEEDVLARWLDFQVSTRSYPLRERRPVRKR